MYEIIFLRCRYWEIRKIEKGSNQPGLNTTIIKNFAIPLPKSTTIQKKIVKKIQHITNQIDELDSLKNSQRDYLDSLMDSALFQVFSKPAKKGWSEIEIDKICDVNPSKSEIKECSNDLEVSFVPMAAVSDETGTIEKSYTKSIGEVKNGYTYFKENDVLFAKITPCMENGKIVIARNLKNNIGFGSTEFHVVRTKNEVLPEWIYHFLRQKTYRMKAKKNMTGTAGQQRVPKEFLKQTLIPIPDRKIQKKFTDFLNRLQIYVQQLKEIHETYIYDVPILYDSILKKAYKGGFRV